MTTTCSDLIIRPPFSNGKRSSIPHVGLLRLYLYMALDNRRSSSVSHPLSLRLSLYLRPSFPPSGRCVLLVGYHSGIVELGFPQIRSWLDSSVPFLRIYTSMTRELRHTTPHKHTHSLKTQDSNFYDRSATHTTSHTAFTTTRHPSRLIYNVWTKLRTRTCYCRA